MRIWIRIITIAILPVSLAAQEPLDNRVSGIDPESEEFRMARNSLNELSISQLEDYNVEAMRIVRALGNYLSYLADPQTPALEKQKAYSFALDLFINRDMIVEDSIKFNNAIREHYSIQEFLDKLTFLLGNPIKEINFQNVYTLEKFQGPFNSKDILFDQIVEKKDILSITESRTLTSKNIEAFFVFRRKYIYNDAKNLFLIKLGNVSYKNN